MSKIKLGDEVRDTVSGFQGIAVSCHTYLNGCCRIGVQPPVTSEMKLPDTATFDEPQLVVVKAEAASPGPRDTGGPEKYMPAARPTGGR